MIYNSGKKVERMHNGRVCVHGLLFTLKRKTMGMAMYLTAIVADVSTGPHAKNLIGKVD